MKLLKRLGVQPLVIEVDKLGDVFFFFSKYICMCLCVIVNGYAYLMVWVGTDRVDASFPSMNFILAYY